jgi:hypothetical protein
LSRGPKGRRKQEANADEPSEDGGQPESKEDDRECLASAPASGGTPGLGRGDDVSGFSQIIEDVPYVRLGRVGRDRGIKVVADRPDKFLLFTAR